MILRGHHLLCMLGFKGLGYDSDFIKNMDTIIKKLKDDDDVLIKLVDNVDNICEKCPNNITGVCENEHHEDSIKEMDDTVLNILQIKPETYMKYNDILDKIKLLMTEEVMDDICCNCAWKGYGYCVDGLKNLR
ncbi:DUF1284 domain-containing protein [Thermoanaerobacterium thermosaccharolyticum]|uniref:DUF1284 domain-containing protein n=1 Tax=Thermoanaerobacterium thermosaccharolyticum TaxID=1517 RepID=UPI001781EAC0|nr:DUF1284 domain-containing protein [Thermoanaerobacterium thermosaccharolyticum]MBE0068610.1 DUF1284 domain-containing protein [Thermoanaerobacterium thermosaccharolyticum]MBE0228370.1 DUF1284 domain-containing protein [Thermoanaerobacterium thermosaccharolyticum]